MADQKTNPSHNAGDFRQIEEAIRTTYGCPTSYLGSRQVTEGNWTGVVDIFQLTGHPEAERCYGWQHRESGETKTEIVLGIPPVVSAETAVKAAIQDKK